MVLNEGHWLRQSYQEAVQETVKDIKRLRDVDRVVWQFSQYEFIDRASLAGIDMGQVWRRLIYMRQMNYMIRF